MTLVLHVIFGAVAFIGSLMLGSTFGRQENLSKAQKAAIHMSYFGVLASTVLGFASAMGMGISLVGVIVAAVAYTGFVFFRPMKKVARKEEV